VAQLEVSPPRPRRRHHLRPLDADPKAPSGRRSSNVDRRVAGRPPYGGRGAVRRRRGRSQGEASSGGEGAALRGGCFRLCRASPAARKAASGSGQRTSAGTTPDRGTTGVGGQARTNGRARPQEAPQEAIQRSRRSGRGVSRHPGTCRLRTFSASPSGSERAEPRRDRAGRLGRRDQAPPPAQAEVSAPSS
jgi:hypothetical protein